MIAPEKVKEVHDLIEFEQMLLASSSWKAPVLDDALKRLASLSAEICSVAETGNWRALPQSLQAMAAHVVTLQKAGTLDASALVVLTKARDACYGFDFELRIEDHPIREQAVFYNALAGFDAPSQR